MSMQLCLCALMCVRNCPKHVSSSHYFYKNVPGNWLSMTLVGIIIDSIIYNFAVYFKCLHAISFFLKTLILLIVYYVNSQQEEY